MMRITRIKRTVDFELIRSLLLDDDDHDKEAYVEMIRGKLENDPFNIIIPVCMDNDEVVSYTIVFKDAGQRHAWMAMAWTKPGVTRRVSLALLDVCKTWCEQRGINEIRAETKRDEVRALSRFGFTELAKIVSLKWED